ncbi:cytidine/deoxycytidylate deaminase family protein [candidate division WOR-3 bacterium]|nr:cytidine/deoxycytidylate deaminase family protein [candidate division WOR-3 bacterium]
MQTEAPRKSWDEYFMAIARLVADRSTCLRRHVGAVLVRDKRLLCTGYNGAPAGMRHCFETGCLRDELGIPAGERIEICRGIHAEQNALVQAATFGINVAGATLYCTHEPCVTCAKMLINARVREFVVGEEYPDAFARRLVEEAGVTVRRTVPEPA